MILVFMNIITNNCVVCGGKRGALIDELEPTIGADSRAAGNDRGFAIRNISKLVNEQLSYIDQSVRGFYLITTFSFLNFAGISESTFLSVSLAQHSAVYSLPGILHLP